MKCLTAFSQSTLPLSDAQELTRNFEVVRTTPLGVSIDYPLTHAAKYDGLFFIEGLSKLRRNRYALKGHVVCRDVEVYTDEAPIRLVEGMGEVADANTTPFPDMETNATLSIPGRLARVMHGLKTIIFSDVPEPQAGLTLFTEWPVRSVGEDVEA